jgi:DNA/RNA endonuclease G (NUC1)
MINTNIAPQWQLFNGRNWAALEDAVRKYVDRNQHSVYVFTGTGKIIERMII